MSLKILLADDSMTAQNMGKKILADAGYDVIAVSNGAAAIKKIPEVKPQLLILDIYMPGYTGLEVCERIKNAPETAHVPVLLTVGKLEPYRPEDGNKVRAEAVIIKPFEASDLLAAVEKLAGHLVSRPVPEAAPVEPVGQNAYVEEEEAPEEEFVAQPAPVAQQEVSATPMPFLADLPAPVPAFAIEESQPPASEAPVFSSYIPASAAPAFFMDDTQPITPLRDSAPSFEISSFMPPSEVAAPVVAEPVDEHVHDVPAAFDIHVAPAAEEHVFATAEVEYSPSFASVEPTEAPVFALQETETATPIEESLEIVPEEAQHKSEDAVFAAPVIAPEMDDTAPAAFAVTQDTAIELEVSGASPWSTMSETVEPTSVYAAPAVSEIEFEATVPQPSIGEPQFAAIEWKEPEALVEEPQHEVVVGNTEDVKGFAANFEAPSPELQLDDAAISLKDEAEELATQPAARQVEVTSETPSVQGRYTDDVLVQLGVIAVTPEPAAASADPTLDFDEEPFFAHEAAATVAPAFAKPEELNFLAEAPVAEEVVSDAIQVVPAHDAAPIEFAQVEEPPSGSNVDAAMFVAFDSLSAEALSAEVSADVSQVAESEEVPQAFAAAAAAGSQTRIASAVQRVFDRYREQMIADIARELEDE